MAALITFALIRTLDWKFGIDATANEEARRWVRVIIAGLGAMAILRITFFTVRSGDRSVDVGLSALLEVLLEATDRAVDRRRAGERNKVIAEVMNGVSYEVAQTALPAYCLGLLQNVGAEEAFQLGNKVVILSGRTDISDELKSRLLGLLILNVVGEQVLRQAVFTLADEIKASLGGEVQLTSQEVEAFVTQERALENASTAAATANPHL